MRCACSTAVGNPRRRRLPRKPRSGPVCFCLYCRNGCSLGTVEQVACPGLEDSVVEGKELGRDRGSQSIFPEHRSSWRAWLYHSSKPGTCFLQIKLRFASTCLAKWNGAKAGALPRAPVSQSESSKCQHMELLLKKRLFRCGKVSGESTHFELVSREMKRTLQNLISCGKRRVRRAFPGPAMGPLTPGDVVAWGEDVTGEV